MTRSRGIAARFRTRRAAEPLEPRLALHSSVLISEAMLAPAAPTAAELAEMEELTADDFEYVELLNPEAATTVSLADMQLSGDVTITLGDHELAPNESVVVVANEPAFRIRYGDGPRIVGEFEGTLANVDTSVNLVDQDAHPVVELNLMANDLWARRATGTGSSLELIHPVTTLASQMSKPQKWQASPQPYGSPGELRSFPRGVWINEVLAGFDAESELTDAIELWNETDEPINIGGWYLSDDPSNPLKFQFGSGTIVPAEGYLVLDASLLNPTPEEPADHHIALDAIDDGQLYLSIAGIDGQLLLYADSIAYGPQEGRSWGRFQADDVSGFGPLSMPTLGAENASGAVGDVLLTEVNYNASLPSPAALSHDDAITAAALEYVEIYNPASLPVDLTGWSLGGDIQFLFPDETKLAAGGSLIVVSFDPQAMESTDRLAAFLAHYGADETIQIVGGYSGELRDDYGVVRLFAPGETDPTVSVRQEQLRYDDLPPWPSEPDGEGLSLNRVALDQFADTAATWNAQTPTPGTVPFQPPVEHLLPDLSFWIDPLQGINHLEFVAPHPTTGRTLMQFATGVANLGRGPLIIEGQPVVNETKPVVQVVENADGSTTKFDAGEYVFHLTHGHVHFADYAIYRLREVTEDDGVGEMVAGGDKISFCLVDSHPYDRSLEGSPSLPQFNKCESQTQGISVGWADLYTADLPDQWIDIEDVPAGQYWFETVVDPFNILIESDETNNVFRTKVNLHDPTYDPDWLDADDTNELRLNGDTVLEDLSIHEPGDVDTFRWTAPRDGQLTVELDLTEEAGDVDLYVWGTDDDNQVVVHESVTNDNQEQVTIDVKGAKTYFLVAKDLSGSTHPNYRLIVDGPGVPPDAHEPNDSVLQLAELGVGEMLVDQLTLDGPMDQDFFAWTADQDQTARVDLRFDHQLADVDLFLHDFDNNVVYSSTTEGQEFVEFETTRDSSYVAIVLSPVNEPLPEYEIEFSYVSIPVDPQEPNNAIAAATDLGTGAVKLENATIHRSDDPDYYFWTAPSSGPAVVDLIFAQSDGDLELAQLQEDGTPITVASTVDDNEQLILEAVAGETYWLMVRGINASTSPGYQLAVTPTRPPNVDAAQLIKGSDSSIRIDLLAEPDPPTILPWLDLNQIEIQFSTDVTVATSDLIITGESVPSYEVLELAYDDQQHRATWTVQSPVQGDRIEARLLDSVIDRYGNSVAAWTRQWQALPGDFNLDGELDINDIDALAAGIREGDAFFDLNADQEQNEDDIRTLVTFSFNTVIGDSNLDQSFDSRDMIQVFQIGEFEDKRLQNSTWADGDWNGDGEFDSSDLVFAFQEGQYEL